MPPPRGSMPKTMPKTSLLPRSGVLSENACALQGLVAGRCVRNACIPRSAASENVLLDQALQKDSCLPTDTEAAVHRSPGHGPSGFSALLPPEAGPGASCKSTSPAVIRKKPLCPSSPARAKHEAAGRQKKGRRLKARCAPCKRPCRKALLTPRAGLRRFPPRSSVRRKDAPSVPPFLRH